MLHEQHRTALCLLGFGLYLLNTQWSPGQDQCLPRLDPQAGKLQVIHLSCTASRFPDRLDVTVCNAHLRTAQPTRGVPAGSHTAAARAGVWASRALNARPSRPVVPCSGSQLLESNVSGKASITNSLPGSY